LTDNIVIAISRSIPAFFSQADEQFEFDLARAASFGFIHQRQFGIGEADRQIDARKKKTLLQRQQEASAELQRLMNFEMGRSGRAEFEMKEYHQQSQQTRTLIDERKDAYMGWLILNQDYLQELFILKRKWQKYVGQIGRFPTYPRWLGVDYVMEYKFKKKFRKDCLDFYKRWGLDSLTTWDWPNVMEPDLGSQMLSDLDDLAETGVPLFIPWYLLRGRSFDLQSIVRGTCVYGAGKHLRGWLQLHDPSSRDGTGDIRYRNVQWIYRYFFLALFHRYRQQCEGRLNAIDEVFASLLKLNSESVKRLRQRIQRAHSNEPA
jgi:hypothetical protein